MNDATRHAAPLRLDDPERWLFWTLDEAAALLGPAVLGLAANAFVTGLVADVAGWMLLRRVKRGAGRTSRSTHCTGSCRGSCSDFARHPRTTCGDTPDEVREHGFGAAAGTGRARGARRAARALGGGEPGALGGARLSRDGDRARARGVGSGLGGGHELGGAAVSGGRGAHRGSDVAHANARERGPRARDGVADKSRGGIAGTALLATAFAAFTVDRPPPRPL